MTVYLTNLHQTQDKKEAFTCNKQDQSPILKCYWPLQNISSTGNSGWRPVIPSYLQFCSYYWPRYMSLLHYVKPRSVSRTFIARVFGLNHAVRSSFDAPFLARYVKSNDSHWTPDYKEQSATRTSASHTVLFWTGFSIRSMYAVMSLSFFTP